MYNGVKAMILEEISLAPKKAPEPVKEEPVKTEPEKEEIGPGADIQAGRHLKTISNLTGYPQFPPNTTSLLCKHLTKDIFNKYFNE
jgi:hypothetical protein